MTSTADGAARIPAPPENSPAATGRSSTVSSTAPPASPTFPGCRSFRLTRDAVDRYDGRFEYWDAATETAWVVSEPTGATHERPTRRLPGLCRLIASLRGSAIECRGSTDLIWNAGDRRRRRILQADEVVYVYPARARIPDEGLAIGEHDLPDVVLEVDHTTDVRRGKLGLYATWGFPEVWVDVPDVPSPSRPAGRAPGLTIHRLDAGGYRTVASSGAFPGWTAAEIHAALDEPEPSAATDHVIDRVARALGARDGTSPDHTPWLRRERDEGRAEGLVEGRADARAEGRAEVLLAILAARGMEDMAPVLATVDLAGLPLQILVDAVQRCRDAVDLRLRLQMGSP